MWEFENYQWSRLKATFPAERLPAEIGALARARTAEEATTASQVIEATVLIQATVLEAALPTVSCLVLALHRCTDFGRPRVLELLSLICHGDWAEDLSLIDRCRRELFLGTSFYFHMLEFGSEEERFQAIGLVGLCCELDETLSERFLLSLGKLSELRLGSELRTLVEAWSVPSVQSPLSTGESGPKKDE